MLRGVLITLLLLLAGPALAGVDDVIVQSAWLHETVKGQQEVSVHLTLSVAKPSRLLALSSPVAAGGELRRFVREHGKMEQRAVASLKLPARSTVNFGMRNVDLMLTGLQQRLNDGEHVSIKLLLEVAGQPQEISVQAEVHAADLSYQQF